MDTSSEFVTLLPIILGLLFALGCLIGSFIFLRRKRLIDDLPTSKTQGVFIGLTELKGTAESDTPLSSYLSNTSCVEYKWQVQEHWSRMVTETYTDAKGNTHTRTRVESGWMTVAHDEQYIPFYLKDDTGVIRILPDRASIHDNEVFDETCGPGSPLYYEKGPAHSIPDSTHRRRFRETAIPLHAMLYVVGQARERQDVVAAEIAYDGSAPMFFISTKTEKQVTRGYNAGYLSLLVVSLVLVMAGIGVASALGQPGISGVTYIIGIAAFLVATGIGWLWTVYNSLVGLRQRVLRAWSQVEIQLKRRNDLIPNLVKVIEGYKQYERELQQDLTEIRGQLGATPPGEAGDDFNGLASKLRVVVERYPELKAGEVFLNLQRSLAETEERIALARDYFNAIATFYNTRLTIIPDRFVAALVGCRTRQLMSAGDFERAPVQVSLVS
jgi:hypothetical protein